MSRIMIPRLPDRAHLAPAAAIFLACLVFYSLTNYGGVRSPDNEVVFRAALSFVDHGRLDVGRGLEDWPGFGIATSRDGANYPVFGPAGSIALAPFILVARAVNGTRWYQGVPLPPSHYVANGLYSALYGLPLRNPEEHALRLLCSWYNIVVSALGAAVFYFVMLRFVTATGIAVAMTALFAFGTLAWPYANTFFSEPLALLLLLVSFHGIAGHARRGGDGGTNGGGRDRGMAEAAWSPAAAAGSGLALGLAVSAHITAALFIPFFALVPIAAVLRRSRPGARRALLLFLAGLAAALGLLAWYNGQRFGSILETGRSAGPDASLDATFFGYGTFVAPWRGLYGLMLGSAKGLLVYSPAVLLGFAGWRAFHRRDPFFSWMLAAAAIVRVFFIASRSDWHGGFCAGPRYLVMLIPFLLIPAGVAAEERFRRGDRRVLPALGVVMVLCAAEQVYLSLGEIFAYFHTIKFRAMKAGVEIFAGDRMYLDWAISPLRDLWRVEAGPFLLRVAGPAAPPRWLVLPIILTALAAAWVFAARRRAAITNHRMRSSG